MNIQTFQIQALSFQLILKCPKNQDLNKCVYCLKENDGGDHLVCNIAVSRYSRADKGRRAGSPAVTVRIIS